MKKLFLVLCVLGVVLPYYQLYYFLLENNWSMSGFWSDIYSNHAISMITMDITVAATSYLVFIIYQFSNKKIHLKWGNMMIILSIDSSFCFWNFKRREPPYRYTKRSI